MRAKRIFRQQFTGTVELLSKAMALDKAEKYPIYLNMSGDNYDQQEGEYAVFNIDKQKMSCTVKEGYNVLQHKDFVETVSQTLIGLNVPIKGKIVDFGNRIHCDILIDQEQEVNGEKFHFGFRISNSYDKSCSIKAELYGVRLACQNGMLLTTFGSVILKEHHNTTKDVEQLTISMIKNGCNVNEKLNAVISSAMAESFEWQLAEQVLEKIAINEKYKKAFKEIVDRDYPGKLNQLTKWDVYNVITNLASHDRALSSNAFNRFEKEAHNFLSKSKAQIERELEVV